MMKDCMPAALWSEDRAQVRITSSFEYAAVKYCNVGDASTVHTGPVETGGAYPARPVPTAPPVAPLESPRQDRLELPELTTPLAPPFTVTLTAAGKEAPTAHTIPPPPPPPGPVQSLTR